MFPLRDNVVRTSDPIVVWVLIALNVAVFGYELSLNERDLQTLLLKHGLVPARYFVPSWAWQTGVSSLDFTPLLTTTFLHGGFLHIILNLWTLWIFGPALEDRLGPARFAALYLLSAIAASVTHALFNATSTLPVVGASGAIAGVIAAYAVRFPYAWIRVVVLIIIVPIFFQVPAAFFAAIWFLTQVLHGTTELFSPFGGGGGIAWWAHIGGFGAGAVLLLWLEQRDRPAVRYERGPWER